MSKLELPYFNFIETNLQTLYLDFKMVRFLAACLLVDSPDGLLPLGLPDLGLLVALGEDVGERGAHDGALELLGLLCPLLGCLLLNALAVLPAMRGKKWLKIRETNGFYSENHGVELLVKQLPIMPLSRETGKTSTIFCPTPK